MSWPQPQRSCLQVLLEMGDGIYAQPGMLDLPDAAAAAEQLQALEQPRSSSTSAMTAAAEEPQVSTSISGHTNQYKSLLQDCKLLQWWQCCSLDVTGWHAVISFMSCTAIYGRSQAGSLSDLMDPFASPQTHLHSFLQGTLPGVLRALLWRSAAPTVEGGTPSRVDDESSQQMSQPTVVLPEHASSPPATLRFLQSQGAAASPIRLNATSAAEELIDMMMH